MRATIARIKQLEYALERDFGIIPSTLHYLWDPWKLEVGGGGTLVWKGWAQGIGVGGGGGGGGGGGVFLGGGAFSGDFQHGCDKMHA